MTEYVAQFCPHCHGHVNEDELLNDHDLSPADVRETTAVPRNMGSTYTCGWCQETTRDWNHVIQCRIEHTERRRINHEKRAMDLQLMLMEMNAVRRPTLRV